MIVVGVDPHMNTKTHTAVAIDAATGRDIGTKTGGCDGVRGMTDR